MDDTFLRTEHEEFAQRMKVEMQRLEDEDDRQNKRLDTLESNMNQIIMHQLTSLTTTMEKLNLSVNNMLKEQEGISKRVERLENRDGDMWRTAVKYALSAIVGGLIAFAFARLGA